MTMDRYAEAGVDLKAADEAKARIASLVLGTHTELAAGAVGGFGGMLRLPSGLRRPLLVMSTDGVGTKVLVARECQQLGTVGEDLVNHCVNDVLVHGATPIAFQDYLAGADLSIDDTGTIVGGVARACRNHQMLLTGGETAQMPGLYQSGHFDLAGTILGVVEEEDALHGDRVRPGDLLIGYESTGLHTNGFTLARRVFFDDLGLSVESRVEELSSTVGEALLAVHRSYWGALRGIVGRVHALAHITGGGIPGNLVRVLPPGCRAVVRRSSWPCPPLFDLLQRAGDIEPREMADVFNLGLGMIAVVAEPLLAEAQLQAQEAGVLTWVVGAIQAGVPGVDVE
jgi:phosphoribosylformylglycinamidine cyclo-ligase